VLDDYLPILVLLILGLLFAGLSFVASGLLAPKKRPTAAKVAPYECGIVPAIEPPTRFPVRFYLIAMIFIIFDIEIVFLYPWAVIFRQLRSFGLVEVIVFAAVVFVSFLFLISNGALNWGPAKRLSSATPPRTSDSTIARIKAGPGGPGPTRGPAASPTDPRAPAISDPDAPTTGDPAPVPTGPGRAA
jgi:NADH-quinone oxidoreductase subunit A